MSGSQQIRHQEAPPRGFFGKSFVLVSKLFGVLAFSVVLSVLFEWINMAFSLENASYQHARDMLHFELSFLMSGVDQDTANPMLYDVQSHTRNAVEYLLIDSGAVDFIQKARTVSANDPAFIQFAKTFFALISDYAVAALYVVATFLVRFSIFCLSAPIFLLFAAVGFFDGLAQRDLRRWQGGHESGYVYHIAKSLSLPIAIFSFMLYLSLPMSVHPNVVLIPFAIAFAFAVWTAARLFKKYL